MEFPVTEPTTAHQQHQSPNKRQQRKERRQQQRIQRIENLQKRLQTLREKQVAKKRHLIFRIIRSIAVGLILIPAGLLAVALRSFDPLDFALRILWSELKGTAKASETHDDAEKALEIVQIEASEMGLESHGVMLADPPLADSGSLSVASTDSDLGNAADAPESADANLT